MDSSIGDLLMDELREIEQILGRALGYPRYCDDKDNFPDATEQDGVCVGDHTAVTLAQEAAECMNSQLSALMSIITTK